MAEMSIWVPVIGTLGGAFIGAASAFANNLVNKKYEEKKHLREIMVNAAIENWKQNCNMASIQMSKGIKVAIAPLDSFIIHMAKLTEVLLDDNLTKDNLHIKCKQISEVVAAHKTYLENESKTEKAQSGKGGSFSRPPHTT